MMKRSLSALGVILVVVLIAGICRGERMRQRISSIRTQASTSADMEAEHRFGRNLAARILGNWALWDNPKANHYLNLVGQALALYAGNNGTRFSFGLLDSEEVNAFATPGGYIFLTRGAFQMMRDEAQLAAVLGHEMAHVLQRHMVRELNLRPGGTSAVGGLAELIGGATHSMRASLERSMEQAADILFKKGYRLEDELEADRVGLLLSVSAGYAPSGLADYLQSIGLFEVAPRSGQKDHPVLEERLAAIRHTLTINGMTGLSGARNKERFHDMASIH
ncbi:MAG: hypothetical protein C4519_18900 [Desulfobacteraceae bacterium]|nr:MAG: hypothetical protein C4519_18900 [Desulfobacteraceae bacterium]